MFVVRRVVRTHSFLRETRTRYGSAPRVSSARSGARPIPPCSPFRWPNSSAPTFGPSERLGPPITQLLDSRIYQLKGRVSSFPSFEPLFLFFMVVVAFFTVISSSFATIFLGGTSVLDARYCIPSILPRSSITIIS
jgi:hypothetical protein